MKVLIFDLDGTLIDSKRDIVFSVNQAFLQLGFPAMPEDKVAGEIGRGAEYLFRRLLGAETPDPTIKELAGWCKEFYRRHLLDHTRIYPGVVEALTHFSTYSKVIVTNKNQAFADRIVDAVGLRKHFQGVFGSEAFSTQKPDPGPILEVCKQWNINPSEAVVIGDSEFDIIAGKKAGARTVGVLYGIGRPEAFGVNVPDFQIASADELIPLIPQVQGA